MPPPATTLPVTRRIKRARESAPDAPPRRPPPLRLVLGNAGKAFVRVVKAAASGSPLRRAPAEQETLLEICSACDRWDAARGRCLECGCFGALKVRLLTEHCPLGKW